MTARPRLRSVFGVPLWEAEAAGEDGQWRWAEEGEPPLGPEFESIWRRLSTFGSLQNVHWAQRGPSYRPNHLRLGEVRRDDTAGLEVVLYEQTKANYEPYARDIEDVIPPLAFTTAQAAEVTELRLGIIDYVAQMTAEFVLGRQDLDAGWDNFVATLDALGINRVVRFTKRLTMRSMVSRSTPLLRAGKPPAAPCIDDQNLYGRLGESPK